MEVLNFGKSFEEYLLLRVGVSKNTLKFYRSDFNHFIRWFLLRIRLFGFFAQDIESALPYLTRDEAQNYKAYLEENRTPTRSINRRLSTLRQMSRFLLEQGLVSFNFMEGVTNSGIKSVSKKDVETDLGSKFAIYLRTQQVSHTTVKNYLSDIKHFMAWIETNKIPNQLNNMTTTLIKNYTTEVIKNGSLVTAKRRLSSLKKFFGWAYEQNFINRNPFLENISKTTLPSRNRLKYLFSISNIIKFGLIEGFLILGFFLLQKINPSLNPWTIINKTNQLTSFSSTTISNEILTNATSGTAKIPSGRDGVTIKNSRITDYTVVYIKPTSQDTDQVLLIKTKGLGFFTAGFDQTSDKDVTFNWRLVDVK